MSRYELKLSGSGGQGLILAGLILAEAAALYDGKNAVQTQSYGPESRGGSSSSVVIISDEDIDYPKATKVDVLLALTQEAANKYAGDIKDGGILIVDEEMVRDVPTGKYQTFKLPIIATARTKIGKVIVANIVALAVIVGLTEVVSIDAVKKALFSRIPKGTEDLNLKALEAGIELAKDAYYAMSLDSEYIEKQIM
jgi:2-oxoglutarate ferredoxin oxidoreductase subunit gamma